MRIYHTRGDELRYAKFRKSNFQSVCSRVFLKMKVKQYPRLENTKGVSWALDQQILQKMFIKVTSRRENYLNGSTKYSSSVQE